MKEENTILKERLNRLANTAAEVYFIVPLVISFVLYYIFFRYHRYLYESDAIVVFLKYFGINIFLFALVVGYIVYRYRFYVPLLEEGFEGEEIKKQGPKIIFSYTLRYLPIIFLLLQVFFYAVNIYTAQTPIAIDTVVQEVGDRYVPLAPKNWVGIVLPESTEMIYMQTIAPKKVGDVYKKDIYQGFWLKYTEM